MMLLVSMSLCMVACDLDEPRKPENSVPRSDFGALTHTGLKRIKMYHFYHKPATFLQIPGFPRLFCILEGYGDLELHVHAEAGWRSELLDCGITNSMKSFNWTETSSDFVSEVKLTNANYGNREIYRGKSMIFRILISEADEYPRRFAYARIRFIDLLYSNDGDIIGCTLEYDSPYTPL